MVNSVSWPWQTEYEVVMSGVPEPETAMLREIRKQCLQNAADLLRRGTQEALAVRDEVNAVANTVQARQHGALSRRRGWRWVSRNLIA